MPRSNNTGLGTATCRRCGIQFEKTGRRQLACGDCRPLIEAEAARDRKFQYRYGITTEEYDRMWLERNGLCDICKSDGGNKPLGVDHDHQTREVRGLLCWSCNILIGLARDRTDILGDAISYLLREEQ